MPTRNTVVLCALLCGASSAAHATHSGKVYDKVFPTAAEARAHCPHPGDWVSRYHGKGGAGYICRYGGAAAK